MTVSTSSLVIRVLRCRGFGRSVAKNGTWLALFFAILISGASARPSPVICSEIFGNQQAQPTPHGFSDQIQIRYGTLKSGFPHTTKYSVDLTEQSEVRNQCNLGTCHLHSWVSLLEKDHILDERETIKLSTHYLSAKHWLARSLELLDYKDRTAEERANIKGKGIKLKLGADVFVSRRSIVSYGLIPDEAWTARRDFQEAPFSSRISEYISNIVARTKWDIEHEINADRRKEIAEQGRHEIRSIFSNIIGQIPQEFAFRGKNYTPITFAKEFFPELQKPIVQMRVNRKDNMKTIVDDVPRGYAVVKTNIDNLEKSARELIDRGINVYLSYHHNGNYVDSSSGIMSISAFHHPSGGSPVNREQRDYYDLEGGGHAVQIVGYDTDPVTGKVIKWKIKNSWGATRGDLGYYHMYDDYFRTFVTSISFFKGSGVQLPPQEGPTESKQLELPFK